MGSPLHRWPRTGRRRLALLAAVALAMLFMLGSCSPYHRSQPLPTAQLLPAQNKFVQISDFATAADGAGISRTQPQAVRIGIEITNIYNVSLNEQTFMANGYYWLQWPATVQQWMDEEGIDPEDLIQFTNNIVSYDFLVKPKIKKPRVLADGAREQTFLFSGHFWIESIDFHQFPFQQLQIPLRFEMKPEAFSLNGNRPVALLANAQQPDLLGSLIEIPGLVLEGGLLEPFVHSFSDDTSIASGHQAMTFSQVRASAVFRTHPITSLGEWLMPILIVMLTVFVAPSISGRLSDMRIAVPSAALLTLVVMQQSFESAIPQLSYLTFLDLVYLWCYTITAALFVLFVWSANSYADTESRCGSNGAQLAATISRINRIDRRFQLISLIGSAAFIAVALLR